MTEQQKALRAAHDAIRALEKIKDDVDKQVRAAYMIYNALYNALQLPDVDGDEYPDTDTSPWWGAEAASYKASAIHRPMTGKWAGCVEWLLSGASGASDPDISEEFDTVAEALAWANEEADRRANKFAKQEA